MNMFYHINNILFFSCRETETFESVAEDDQLPQVVEELHDVHVCPGSPLAKMQLKVKGEVINQYKNAPHLRQSAADCNSLIHVTQECC